MVTMVTMRTMVTMVTVVTNTMVMMLAMLITACYSQADIACLTFVGNAQKRLYFTMFTMLYLYLEFVFGSSCIWNLYLELHIEGCARKKKRCSRRLLCPPSGHGPVRRRAKGEG